LLSIFARFICFYEPVIPIENDIVISPIQHAPGERHAGGAVKHGGNQRIAVCFLGYFYNVIR
jgi:hypothetical protein